MSDLNSWEDDPSAQDENLARQAQQQLNMNNPAPAQGGFRPGIASFQPGAQSFQPGQQYGGYAPQHQQQQYYQQGYYPQYGQQQQQGFNQYNQYGGGFSQGYGMMRCAKFTTFLI
jgi:peptide chain release factor subunit 3